jgi:hypothetical protein
MWDCVSRRMRLVPWLEMWKGADDEPSAAEDSSTMRRFGSRRCMWWSIAIRPPDDAATCRDLAAADCHGWATEVCDPIQLDCRPRILQMRLGSTRHSHA